MTYGHMPLFPAPCSRKSTMCMPLFEACEPVRPCGECQTVHIQNPACPGEYAEVDLCVDGEGNLSICVRRPPKACIPCRSRRPKPGCSCSTWMR